MIWCGVECSFKITLESRQTASCQVSKPFNIYIEFEVSIHKLFNVYFLGNTIIKKYTCQFRLLLQKYNQQFFTFNICKCIDYLSVIVIWHQGMNKIRYQ